MSSYSLEDVRSTIWVTEGTMADEFGQVLEEIANGEDVDEAAMRDAMSWARGVITRWNLEDAVTP